MEPLSTSMTASWMENNQPFTGKGIPKENFAMDQGYNCRIYMSESMSFSKSKSG